MLFYIIEQDRSDVHHYFWDTASHARSYARSSLNQLLSENIGWVSDRDVLKDHITLQLPLPYSDNETTIKQSVFDLYPELCI